MAFASPMKLKTVKTANKILSVFITFCDFMSAGLHSLYRFSIKTTTFVDNIINFTFYMKFVEPASGEMGVVGDEN